MPVKLVQSSAGSLAKGVNVHTPDFQADIELRPECVNMTSGINEGIGPRYGFSPLPGQLDNESINYATQTPNFRVAETTLFSGGSQQRLNVYGIYRFKLGGCDSAANLANRQFYYVALVSYNDSAFSGKVFFDTLFLGTVSSSVYAQSPLIYSGLTLPMIDLINSQVNNELLNTSAGFLQSNAITPGTNYVSSTAFSVNGPNVPSQWLIGLATGTVNTSTIAPSLNLTPNLGFFFSSNALESFAGITSDIVAGTFTQGQRTVNVYALLQNGNQNIDYSVNFPASTTQFRPAFTLASQSYPEIDLSTAAAASTGGGTNYSSTYAALYNDAQTFTNSSYQGVLAAAGKPYCSIFQDWQRSAAGQLPQIIDLTSISITPSAVKTYVYTENGTPVNTVWGYFPVYVAGTAFSGQDGVVLNGTGTGLLRATTTYEFSFSVYNKRLNFETNVGPGVKLVTGTADMVSLQLWDNATFGSSNTQINLLANAGISVVPWPGYFSAGTFDSPTAFGGSTQAVSINHLEYRFYYRELGAQEWLPALFIDAAQWWFYPHHKNLSLCTGGIGGVPGGRPGGYTDYSNLPQDQYNCVVMYKNRAFWFSDKALCFSYQNNIFAYPTGNNAACPAGSFRGAIVATYYGQAQQQARLVVFTTQGTYIGLFTGNPVDIPVQVDSAGTIGSFPLDGSDFALNAWTSVSAFSYRSAVVAEGILYFWGPDGIFIDDGVDPIQRISIPLEPDIFQYYDPSKTDQIHCLYNNNTKEITWFYPPKVADAINPTYGLVFNRVRNTWLPQQFGGQIDASQSLKIDSPIPTAGSRAMVFSRQSPSSTVQRPYFYDERNLAGDIYPGSELLVQAISTPSAGVRRFTLATGYSPNLSTIQVGDVICAQQVAAYATTLVDPNDFIGTVAAVGAGTLDITLPTGLVFDASATFATNNLYFPIYHAAAQYSAAQRQIVMTGPGLNGFNFNLPTYYWIPQGIAYWALWLFVHQVYKLRVYLPTTTPLNVTFAHGTPISEDLVSAILTFANNSNNNFQVFHPLALGNQNLEGQALEMAWSGVQIGSNWVLQFVEAFSQPLDGMQLRNFEG